MNIKWLIRSLIGIGVVSNIILLHYLGINFSHSKFIVFTVFLITWLMLPYIVWGFVNEFRPNTFTKRRFVTIGLAIVMPVVGFAMVGYTSLYPDPQAGFFIFYIPFIQFICLGIAWKACKQ